MASISAPLLVAALVVSATFRPLRNTVTVSDTRKMSSMKCEMKKENAPSSSPPPRPPPTHHPPTHPPPPQRREQPLDLGRGEGGRRLIQDDDARAGEQHARDLDQLLKPDREVAEP